MKMCIMCLERLAEDYSDYCKECEEILKEEIHNGNKCYICDSKMGYKDIKFNNPKWGSSDITVLENVKAWVCNNVGCGEIVFDFDEAERLQELSQNYK